MDKPKMLVIVGDDFAGLSKDLIAMGEKLHMDIEVVNIGNTLVGTKPKLQIWDEHTSLVDVDFSKLEERISGLYDFVVEGGGGSVLTGRISKSEPEFQDLPMDKAHRERMKEWYFPYAYGVGSFWGGLQNIPRRAIKSPAFAMPYGKQEHAADHPSRKREPKGPRKKWGKL